MIPTTPVFPEAILLIRKQPIALHPQPQIIDLVYLLKF